MMSLVQYRLK